ncbi:MAG TPA: NAD(+)/NADH kinase [Bacteroidales bacterium]|jgi:NAD+ kinase|nr:NAD(+)/NADH kinase [Bacteroidales bacterium]HQJ81697.1 NAD(+)/NADH kinase [Bacteroidales bacterium]
MLKRVAIYSKDSNDRTREAVQKLVSEFLKRDIEVNLYQKAGDTRFSFSREEVTPFTSLAMLPARPDMILSVGGDGTFLETVLKVKDSGIPVAGVNTGRMGFLANIPNEELGNSVDHLCSGDYQIIERSMLEITSPPGLFNGESSTVLNEITIQKLLLSMIIIHVYVDDVFLNTYWADGLIVSTATGSTAYNLSAGGPILSPGDESIIISPMSPHNLTIRPIVLSGSSRLRMVMEGRTEECLLTCDFRFRKIPISEEIIIVKSKSRLGTVMLKGRDFYSTLRNRLMWGADTRN